MVLQEGEKAEVVLSPSAKRARIIDLENKAECWRGHIKIAQEKGDLGQARMGEGRLIALRNQIGKD